MLLQCNMSVASLRFGTRKFAVRNVPQKADSVLLLFFLLFVSSSDHCIKPEL